jgi:CheY-like chemotaxis protein
MAGKRVLIIDDSRSARAFLARMLERHGLEVDGVRSAEEGFAYLRRQLPDALFLDHLMPGMDGFQALALIKKDARTAGVPVMMYTSQQGETYLEQAKQLGALGVLPKQLSSADVSNALQLLGLHQPDVELAQVTTVIEPQRAPVRAVGAAPPMPAAPATPAAASAPSAAPGLPNTITPELRALLQSMAVDQGRTARDPLLQEQLQEVARQLGQQIERQGERLYAELRALRREFAHLPPPDPKESPLATTIVEGEAAAAHRATSGRAPPGRPPVPPEVVAAVAEARRSLARGSEASSARRGRSWPLNLALAILLLGAVAGAAWLWRASLEPKAGVASQALRPVAQGPSAFASGPAPAAQPGAGSAGTAAPTTGARGLPPWPGNASGAYERPAGAAAAPATDPESAATEAQAPEAASAEPATGPYVPPRP